MKLSKKALEDFESYVSNTTFQGDTFKDYHDWLNEEVDNPDYISDTHTISHPQVGDKKISRYKLYEVEE